MRRVILGVILAVGFAGLAQAADFIVVKSTDPAFKRGQELGAGERVALGAGKTLTVMRASGEISTITGAGSGVTLPGARLAQSDTARFNALRSLVQPPPEGRTFGARRGGTCAPATSLLTMDDILRASDSGCKTQAREALSAYIARAEAAPAN